MKKYSKLLVAEKISELRFAELFFFPEQAFNHYYHENKTQQI